MDLLYKLWAANATLWHVIDSDFHSPAQYTTQIFVHSASAKTIAVNPVKVLVLNESSTSSILLYITCRWFLF